MTDDELIAFADVLEIDRPLVFLDLETTGLNQSEDRIVQFAALKVYPPTWAQRPAGAGRVTRFDTLVNPCRPIPPSATEVHRITDAMVTKAPAFGQIGMKIAAALHGCDVVSYNARKLDWPMLEAEFQRCQLSMPECRVIDPFTIWQRMEPRDLSSAVKVFCDDSVSTEQAHNAMADALNLARVLHGQVGRYLDQLLPTDGIRPTEHLVKASTRREPNWLDERGLFRWVDGAARIWFGKKHHGKALADVPKDYLQWMLGQTFSTDTQAICRDALAGRYPDQPAA